MDDEVVVLVDENNKVLGTAPKLATHNGNTPLHRGFSVFLFNEKKELLLQQRSLRKKTWPGVWSNSCCGHPALDELNVDAARRRLKFELGINDVELFEVLPNYRYKTQMNGIWENEICPVMVGFSNQEPKINTEEVAAIKWVHWKKFLTEIEQNPGTYSFWAEDEAKQLVENDLFKTLLGNLSS